MTGLVVFSKKLKGELLESGPKTNEDNIISKDKKEGRAKKVAHTGKAGILFDEDDVEKNDTQADVTSNGDGENCEVEKEATGSRNSRGKDRYDAMISIFRLKCMYMFVLVLLQTELAKRNCWTEELSIFSATIVHEILQIKGARNNAFQSGKFIKMVEHYTNAIMRNIKSRPFAAICLCNRAAAHQSLGNVIDAIAY
ncbi:DnaJ domain, zinc finger, CCHC-type, tetratricopeptide-like helical domain protein [Tanacetum coccineum]